MREAFKRFVKEPNRDNFLAIRTLVVASDHYQPYSSEMETAMKHGAAGNYQEALNGLQEAMGNLLLSPRAHHMVAFLSSNIGGQEPMVKMEHLIADACLQGLLATGDGSRDAPYQVVRVSDEYDVLQELGKELQNQSILEADGRYLDSVVCQDGSTIWFDISDAKQHLLRSLGAS